MPVICDRSIIRPPSVVDRPATLCPPPRTATCKLCSRASWIASTTSLLPRQRAINAGRLSIRPLWIFLASSYLGSVACRSRPENLLDRSAIESVSALVILRFPVRLLASFGTLAVFGGKRQTIGIVRRSLQQHCSWFGAESLPLSAPAASPASGACRSNIG